MNQDLSIISLIAHASLTVQLVIAALLLVSLASWSVIFSKLIALGRVKARNEGFEQEFWSGKNLNDLYTSVSNRPDGAPLERIFASGMREFLKLREKRVVDSGALLDGANIHHLVLDQNMSVLEGSLGILPRRVLVADEQVGRARRLLNEAGMGKELRPEDGSR